MSGVTPAIAVLGALAVSSAIGVVAAHRPLHAALWMVLHFGVTALLYLALHAPFIAAAQLIVYAGAIMVLFVFVVMLLGTGEVSLAEPLGGQRPLALVAVVALVAALARAVGAEMPPAAQAAPEGFGSAEAIGAALLGDWVLPLELMGLLLLAALLGVIVIGHHRGRAPGAGAGAAGAAPSGEDGS